MISSSIVGSTLPDAFKSISQPANYVVKLLNNLSFVQSAPILCAGVTAYEALKQLELITESYVGILGAAGKLVLRSFCD